MTASNITELITRHVDHDVLTVNHTNSRIALLLKVYLNLGAK